MSYRDDDDARRARITWLEAALERRSSPPQWPAARIALLSALATLSIARLASDARALAPPLHARRRLALVALVVRSDTTPLSFGPGSPCSLVVAYDRGVHACEATLRCMGNAVPTGPLVCGTREDHLEWTTPSPGAIRGVVLERAAGLVVVRPRSDGNEIEATITAFRDVVVPRPR